MSTAGSGGEAAAQGGHVRLEVPSLLGGVRADRAVAMVAGVSRAAAARLVASGRVRVDGQAVEDRAFPLVEGSLLEVDVPEAAAGLRGEPEVVVEVVYDDDQVVVVDKPPGLVVHPGAGHATGTLVGGLLARYPDLAQLATAGVCDPLRPGVVHRLDRGTSGLLVVARTPDAYRSLVAQFTARTVQRRYVALLEGHLAEDRGVVDAPIGRSARSPTRMAVSAQGRRARTRYAVLERLEGPPRCLVSLALETGRTHQIRVHLAAIGHPVVGDDRYRPGGARQRGPGAQPPAGRLFLHAYLLGFEHPGTEEWVSWRSPLPEDLVAVLGHAPTLP